MKCANFLANQKFRISYQFATNHNDAKTNYFIVGFAIWTSQTEFSTKLGNMTSPNICGDSFRGLQKPRLCWKQRREEAELQGIWKPYSRCVTLHWALIHAGNNSFCIKIYAKLGKTVVPNEKGANRLQFWNLSHCIVHPGRSSCGLKDLHSIGSKLALDFILGPSIPRGAFRYLGSPKAPEAFSKNKRKEKAYGDSFRGFGFKVGFDDIQLYSYEALESKIWLNSTFDFGETD